MTNIPTGKSIMRTSVIIIFVVCLRTHGYAAAFSNPVNLPDQITGEWAAYSKTALAVTGDVQLTTTTITLGHDQRLTLSYVGKANSSGRVLMSRTPYFIFRIVNPQDIVLLNENTLCGARILPTYVAASVEMATSYELMMWGKKSDGRVEDLELAAYSGKMPPASGDMVENLCGTYRYVRDLTRL
jgi:hypothetical protein